MTWLSELLSLGGMHGKGLSDTDIEAIVGFCLALSIRRLGVSKIAWEMAAPETKC